MADMWKGPLGVSHALGVVGDKGPEGLQGPPGHQPLYKIGHNEPVWIPQRVLSPMMGSSICEIPEGVMDIRHLPKEPGGVLAEAEAKAKAKGLISRTAYTESGAVVLMPQEFDADNLKAYIQQEIKAGIKEHEIALMRKVAEALADTLVEERKKFKAGTHELNCRLNCRMDDEVYESKSRLEAHRLEAQEFDKKRALDIAELQLKVAELQCGLQEKVKETTLLRSKLHAASIKKHVRKIKRRNYDRPSESTPKP